MERTVRQYLSSIITKRGKGVIILIIKCEIECKQLRLKLNSTSENTSADFNADIVVTRHVNDFLLYIFSLASR